MESIQNIKNRSKAVKNVSQITKAMEIVAATKMRKAQQVALSSRPYALRTFELLERLSLESKISSPLMDNRPVKKTLLVLVASDKGLTGAFNAQVIRATDKFLEKNKNQNFIALAIGKKANKHALRKKMEVVREFYGVGDYATPEEVAPISQLIIDGFLSKKWDNVITISTNFISALKQEPLIRQILPVDIEKIRQTMRDIIPEHGRYANFAKDEIEKRFGHKTRETEYIFEPAAEEVINLLIPHLLKMQIYHLILEANASEHSARRVAMKNASDNAEEILEELTLVYNKARQASITNELIEITSTQNALG
ncbi:MAG: ATP synthase F1 subunit gamma [bacterium]|nr:ATP synthase F1 subunit gamma [bacterium]